MLWESPSLSRAHWAAWCEYVRRSHCRLICKNPNYVVRIFTLMDSSMRLHEATRVLFQKSLAFGREFGERQGVAESLEEFAYVSSPESALAKRPGSGVGRCGRDDLGAALPLRDRPATRHALGPSTIRPRSKSRHRTRRAKIAPCRTLDRGLSSVSRSIRARSRSSEVVPRPNATGFSHLRYNSRLLEWGRQFESNCEARLLRCCQRAQRLPVALRKVAAATVKNQPFTELT